MEDTCWHSLIYTSCITLCLLEEIVVRFVVKNVILTMLVEPVIPVDCPRVQGENVCGRCPGALDIIVDISFLLNPLVHHHIPRWFTSSGFTLMRHEIMAISQLLFICSFIIPIFRMTKCWYGIC